MKIDCSFKVGMLGVDGVHALHEEEEIGVAHGAVEAACVIAVMTPFAAHEILERMRFKDLFINMLCCLYYLLAVAPAYPCCDECGYLYVALVGVAMGKLYRVGKDELRRVVAMGEGNK